MPKPQLPPSFLQLLKDSSLDVMLIMQQTLSEAIDVAKADKHLLKPVSPLPTTVNPSDYVDHVDDMNIDEVLSAKILSELESLKLHSRSPNSDKIKTQWLSPSDEDYVYGKITNKPNPISNYPAICELMQLVNSHPTTTSDMDAAIVSCYSTPAAKLRLHEDKEPLICQTSSICTVSFGPPRSLEFVCTHKTTLDKHLRDYKVDLSIPAVHHSMNVMKPGCQQVLKHRVPKALHDDPAPRYSISFRKIVPPNPGIILQPPPADKMKDPGDKPAPTPPTPRKSITLVAGDSFFARLDADRLGKKKQNVINIAKGGSKIDTVLKSIDNFVKNNPDKMVSKCFISIGTNDIRNCENGIMHLKQPLCNFMTSVKQLLPDTKIYLQSLLPIPNNGFKNLEHNVFNMNNLIYSLCSRYSLYFVDTFSLFLDKFGRRNLALFPRFDKDKGRFDIHPNPKGMGVLARKFIFLIHSKWFNPMGY